MNIQERMDFLQELKKDYVFCKKVSCSCGALTEYKEISLAYVFDVTKGKKGEHVLTEFK